MRGDESSGVGVIDNGFLGMGVGLCIWGCMGFFYSLSIDVVRVGICVRGGLIRF